MFSSRRSSLAVVMGVTALAGAGCSSMDVFKVDDPEIVRQIEFRTLEELGGEASNLTPLLVSEDGGIFGPRRVAAATSWESDELPDADWRKLTFDSMRDEFDAQIELAGTLAPPGSGVATSLKTYLDGTEGFKTGVYEAIVTNHSLLIRAVAVDAPPFTITVSRLSSVTLGPVKDSWHAVSLQVGDDMVGPIPLARPKSADAVVAALTAVEPFTARCRAVKVEGDKVMIQTLETEQRLKVSVGEVDREAWARVIEETERRKDAYRAFLGFNFGVGVGFSIDMQRPRRVDDAKVVGGVVRVERDQEALPRILLETHYLFVPNASFLGVVVPGSWGLGPFMGIQASTEEVIDSFAIGWMFGFRRQDLSQSLNIGVGAVLDSRVKVLGHGLRDGQPLPSGETEVRFREESRWGLGVFVSIGF